MNSLTSEQKASVRAIIVIAIVFAGVLIFSLCCSCTSQSAEHYKKIQAQEEMQYNAPYDIEFEPFEIIDISETHILFHKDTAYNLNMMGIVNYKVHKDMVKICQDDNGMYYKTKSMCLELISMTMIDPSEEAFFRKPTE